MAFAFGAPAQPPAANTFGNSAQTLGTPAPAPRFAFGASSSTPAAAPAAGGFFSSSTPAAAPAPSTPAPAFGGFPSSTPAPAFGGLINTSSTPAPAPFGFPQASTAPPAATNFQPTLPITGQTPYSSLPPEAKRAIDSIYEQLMRHKRTMATVETMSPALLRDPAPSTAASGNTLSYLHQQVPLLTQLKSSQSQVKSLQHALDQSRNQALELSRQYEMSTTQSIQYGMWPIEAVAMRRNIQLSKVAPSVTSTDSTAHQQVKDQIQKALNQQVTHVDRLETIPSPYMWQVLRDLLRRLQTLQTQVSSLQADIDSVMHSIHNPQAQVDVASIVQRHADAITRMTYSILSLQSHMESLRSQYSRSVPARGGVDVLHQARVEEAKRLQKLEMDTKAQVLKATPQPTTTPAPGPSTAFGTSPAAATAGGLFGSTTSAPATGGLFGAKSPAPASNVAFGSTPAPAAAFGSSTPAPSTGGGLFGGTTPTPAPFTGFGSTTAPAPTPASTPAPVTTTGGLFGTTTPAAPAPAGHGTFGSTPAGSTPMAPGASGVTSHSAPTPKSKSKSRPRR